MTSLVMSLMLWCLVPISTQSVSMGQVECEISPLVSYCGEVSVMLYLVSYHMSLLYVIVSSQRSLLCHCVLPYVIMSSQMSLPCHCVLSYVSTIIIMSLCPPVSLLCHCVLPYVTTICHCVLPYVTTMSLCPPICHYYMSLCPPICHYYMSLCPPIYHYYRAVSRLIKTLGAHLTCGINVHKAME